MIRIFTMYFYFVLFISTAGVCQNDTLFLYYDSDWNSLTDSSKADYKRVAINNNIGFWEVTDYYKSGQVQMTGMYLDKAMKKQHGRFEWFYPSGQLKRQVTYINRLPNGEEFDYYENGQIDTYRKYDSSGKMEEALFFKEDGSESVVENPEFPGGIRGLYDYLSNYVKYPRSLRKRGIEGKVFITFVIHTDGSLQDVSIIDSPHEGLSLEAVRVVSSMPRWKPGARDGKLVRVKYNLPISFKLD